MPKKKKTKKTAISTSHFIYVPETDTFTKQDINAKYMTGIQGECICIYVPHKRPLATTVRPGELYIDDTNSINYDNKNNTTRIGYLWT